MARHGEIAAGQPRASDPSVIVRNVSKGYTRDLRQSRRNGLRAIGSELRWRKDQTDRHLRDGEFWAVRDVSFSVSPGEALGIVGFNGAGKSTLLRLVAGVTRPTAGTIERVRSVGTVLDPSAGFDPVLTGRENATVAFTLLSGRPPSPEVVDGILEYAGIEAAGGHPVRTYSQGMRLRLGFSIVVFVDPDVLVIDEALTVGDSGFQLQCLEHLRSHCRAGGALIFASHSMWVFQHIATRGLHLDGGRVACEGSPEDVADHYLTAIRAQSVPVEAGAPDLFQRERVIRRSQAPPTTVDGASELAPTEDLDRAPEVSQDRRDAERDPAPTQRPVYYTHVAITAPDGTPPLAGEPLAIKLEVESAEDFDAIAFGMMVWTGDLTICVFADISHDSPEEETIALPTGPSVVRCTIDPNPLLPGPYAFRAAVFDRDTGDILGMTGFEDTPWWFEVAADGRDEHPLTLNGQLRALRTVEGHRRSEVRARVSGQVSRR